MAAVRRALFSDAPTDRPRVPGAARKWKLIEQAGALEEIGPSRRSLKKASGLATSGPKLWIQRAALSLEEARRIITATTLHGNIPEPLRVAHLVAGGITTGKAAAEPEASHDLISPENLHSTNRRRREFPPRREAA